MSRMKNCFWLFVMALMFSCQIQLPANAGSGKPTNGQIDQHDGARAPLDCTVRGQMVEMMVYQMSQGTNLDSISFDYNGLPLNAVEAAFVESVRKEVTGLLAGQAPPKNDRLYSGLLGAQSQTACFAKLEAEENAGVARLESGVAQPTSEEASGMVDVASSERLMTGRHMARKEACRSKLSDDSMIVRYHQREVGEAQMAEHARTSVDLSADPPRLASTLKAIAEAHKYPGGPKAWYENAWNACMAAPEPESGS